MSHRDDFIKFAVISQTGCKGSGFLKPHPLGRRTLGVAHDSQRFCQGTKTTARGGGGGVTPVAGGGQAPASWVKKLGPGQGLPLGIQLRPLAAATPRAACSSRLHLSLNPSPQGEEMLPPYPCLGNQTRPAPTASSLQSKLQRQTSVPTRRSGASLQALQMKTLLF